LANCRTQWLRKEQPIWLQYCCDLRRHEYRRCCPFVLDHQSRFAHFENTLGRKKDANLEAVRRVEAWLEASINAHQAIGVETVLSTSKYRRLVRAAKKRKFEIRLIYVILESPDLNIKRVQMRVRKGGHAVPQKKVRERWSRSLRQLPWFLNECDWALLFDNSKKLRVVGRKTRGTITLDPTAPKALRSAVATIQALKA
jgi:predicted ABC-type ATPase